MTVSQRAAIRTALRSNSEDLLGYFERRVRSREDAADLLGETMLQAWRRADVCPLDDAERQRMWLFTIAANVLANQNRARVRRLNLAQRLRQHVATSGPAFDMADSNAVRDAVLRLRDAQRELIMLIHWDGFTLVEAAEILTINSSTARSRYATAKATLREALTETTCT